MQKTGQIERTVDREFTDEEAKYRVCVRPLCVPPHCLTTLTPHSFERECQALQKDSKGYWDAMRGLPCS